jgi:hypothetical protein
MARADAHLLRRSLPLASRTAGVASSPSARLALDAGSAVAARAAALGRHRRLSPTGGSSGTNAITSTPTSPTSTPGLAWPNRVGDPSRPTVRQARRARHRGRRWLALWTVRHVSGSGHGRVGAGAREPRSPGRCERRRRAHRTQPVVAICRRRALAAATAELRWWTVTVDDDEQRGGWPSEAARCAERDHGPVSDHAIARSPERPRDRVPPASYGRASRMRLNGVSVARRKRLNPASLATCHRRSSPACAPSASPTSWSSEDGVHTTVEAA